MSAYLNALREEGSREELLRQIEKLYAERAEAADEIERLRERIENVRSINDDNVQVSEMFRHQRDAAEAKLAEAVEVVQAVNRRASPDPARTFDDAIRDLEHVTALARAFLAKLGKS